MLLTMLGNADTTVGRLDENTGQQQADRILESYVTDLINAVVKIGEVIASIEQCASVFSYPCHELESRL